LSWDKSALGVLILLAAAVCASAADGSKALLPDNLLVQPAKYSVHASPGAKKSCADVFPIPEARKHWSECEEIEYSECGGPPSQCACQKNDERLVRIQCKEGSYSICKEDDDGCKDDED
jgi:hypothetical protein